MEEPPAEHGGADLRGGLRLCCNSEREHLSKADTSQRHSISSRMSRDGCRLFRAPLTDAHTLIWSNRSAALKQTRRKKRWTLTLEQKMSEHRRSGSVQGIPDVKGYVSECRRNFQTLSWRNSRFCWLTIKQERQLVRPGGLKGASSQFKASF